MYEESGYVVVQRNSNWQKKKVRTIIVNAHAKNPSQKSIAGAIALAKPYDRIELTGGEYNESISIQIPLELVAAEGEDPHILSRSSTVTLTTTGIDVYMERLLISSRSTSKLDAAVVAINGNPILYRCQCTSMLIGGNAMVHVDECTIKDSGSGVGIVVQDSGGGLIKSTSVRTHRHSCMEIDTRGELAVTGCTIDNNVGGDAMVISGAMSSASREGSAPYTSCSHVEVSHCHFSVLGGVGVPSGSPLNLTGDACCIVLTQGAAPTIASNELIEGEIGILIEGPGTAQLKGNVVRCQRRCGVLALVEEGFGYVQDHQTLRITGDNVLDRCRIGIDVQCAANRASYALQNSSTVVNGNTTADAGLLYNANSPPDAADRVLTDELPNPKRAFSWAPVQGGAASACTAKPTSFLPSATPGAITASTPTDNALICVEGEWYPLDKLKANLQQLVRLTLQTYPTCLQPSFGIVAGTALAISEGMSGTPANPFADVLNDMLGTQLSSKREAVPPLREMLQLRGNKGIDIISTKFSNCDVCAIRFGRQGYGLVEECVFEDCGTYAIVVDCAAHPLITGCRFLRSRGASILVSNFANPFIIGNEMASGKRDGIQLSNMSRGLIIGNIIATHVGVGIRVGEHSQPLICANAISQNRKGGVVVADGSRPTILLNSLAANLTAQIYCTEGSDAFICRNRITASADAGVHIDACSRCTVTSNSIRANGEGILVELDADPYVQGNDVVGNIRAGVRARNNALGSFVGNRLVENTGPNVLVSEGAAPVFRGNRIEGSPQGGVVVLNEGHGFFEHNTMAENGVANVLVVGSYSEPQFAHNAMYGSRSGCGIVCAHNAGGAFTHNRIYENTQCGVYICNAADPTLTDNHISREAVGVLVSEGGKGTFTSNVIEDCYGCGILSQRRAHPTFSRNIVTRCKMSGLQVAPDSLGVFSANELTKNDIGVHVGSSLESAVIELNSAFLDDAEDRYNNGSSSEVGSQHSRAPSTAGSRRQSVFASQSDRSVLQTIATTSEQRHTSNARAALSVVSGNIIAKNVNGGVLLDSFPNATVESNDIFENNAYGVRGDCTYAAARAQTILQQKLGTASAAVVQPPQQHSPFAQLQTLMVVRANKIHAHGEANILLDRYNGEVNETVVSQNTVYDAPHGVCVVSNSTVQEVRENDIYHCVDGVCCVSGGRGKFIANRIHDCTYSGVYIADLGNPTFEENRIEQCGFAGVLVDVGGQGTFSKSSVRHCSTGVVVFCGPTTPFQMSYDEVVKARLVRSSPTFTECTIEENEMHGVLLLSVISGCPLRTPLVIPGSVRPSRRQSLETANTATTNAAAEAPPAHDTPIPYTDVDSVTIGARGGRLCAMFEKNVIRRNRIMGIYHDRFEHWDLAALDNAHAERKSQSSSSVKNAYGGYEILLGTSQVLDNTDHQRQRQLKQVSFVDNTIAECSIGVGIGYGCHPYLERNKIHRNTFFGLLLRFGSAVSATGNDIRDNGLAGVYAASGAKGYVANGTIEANNGWCRPEATPNVPRTFTECIFHNSFFSLDAVKSVEETLRATPAATPSVEAARRAYEQMTNLAVVLAFTMTDALRYLADLVAASSVGLTLATGCVPAALGASTTFAATSSQGSSGGAASRKLGGVELSDYTEVCTADGGIGVWVQNGSRVSIVANRITGHRNAGVLVSRGVMQHHRVLHKAFHMESPRKTGNNKLELPATLSANTKVTQRADEGHHIVDIFAVEQHAPALATTEPGAIFTPQKLCVTGILAAVQVAASATLENTNGSFASFAPHSMSLSTLYSPEENEERAQRLDSIHHALIADNVITNNRDGIWLEVFHTLQASASTGAAAAAAAAASAVAASGVSAKRSTVTTTTTTASPFPPQTLSSARVQPALKHSFIPVVSAGSPAGIPSSSVPPSNTSAAAAAAGMAGENFSTAASGCLPVTEDDVKVMDGSFGGLDFSTVVEGNRVLQNRRYGVYAMHVSTINCGSWLTNRGVLKDAVDMQYENVRSQLILGKQNVRIEVRLPFELHAVKQKVGHALLRKNDLSGNEQAQAFITSRQVALTQDGDRTLLQMDTNSGPSASFYASQVLVGVPLFSALLQLPPPGVLLWEENRVRDAKRGVRLCGQLGSHSARFQRNTFVNIAEDAFLVEGHLACASVGKGNLFDRNGVSLRVSQQQQICLVTTPAPSSTTMARHRTRVYQNTFKAARDSSILLDCVGAEAPLLYRNEFTSQPQGSAALYLQSDNAAGAAVVHGNVFADSYVPVFIVGRSGSGVESALSTSRILLLENRFTNNYIGALVCNGAYPVLERNLFDTNARAGLEIVGSGTRPQVRSCLFRQHKRTDDDFAASSSLSTSRPSAALHYPDQGTLMLQCRHFSTTLLPENARVLGPTSQARLPAGLLVGPFAEPFIEGCGFANNDVGVDAVRNAASPSLAVTGINATVKGCVFANHSVCGVLVRGLPNGGDSKGARSMSNGGGAGGIGARMSVGSASRLPVVSDTNDAASCSAAVETTVFEQCVFTDNATADGCGDVVAMDDGYAAFRQNIFSGTVIGQSGATALFAQNRFLGPLLDDGEEGNITPVNAKHTSAAAVVIQEGGRIVADRNTIVRRLVGVKCMPGAEGVVRNNSIVQCVTGVLLAPFNRTDVNKNRVLASGECGAVAYGGRMADNDILQSPAGIVVQHSSAYKGINAVPSHKRDTLEFLCSRNTVTGCTGNGILIATAGTFDSNNISHCKVGVSIVSPIGGGPAGAPPTLKNSNVYDNTTGIYMENDSESAVKDNDVFDNEMVGVVVMPNATGVFQGNRVSSVTDQGAVEIPTEARVKSAGNIIRNQFSPAFQRGTRGGRVKEYQTELANLEKEFDEVAAAVDEAQQTAEDTVNTLQVLQRELVDMHSRSIADSNATLVGSAARALRGNASTAGAPQSLTTGTATPRDQSSTRVGVGKNAATAGEKGSTGGSGNTHSSNNSNQIGNSPATAKRRASNATGRRVASAGARRASVASSSARKVAPKPGSTAPTPLKSAAPPRDTAAGPPKPSSPATAAPKQVLVHVFAKAEARGNAGAVGQVITGVLAQPPLSSHNFVTTITTSTSQLLQVLASPATQPYLCVVVLDTHLGGLSPSDCHALQQLHECALRNTVSKYRGFAAFQDASGDNSNHSNTTTSLFYILVPSSFPIAANKKAVTDAGEGMSIDAYAAAHHLIPYKSSVEEVLTSLHAQIAEDLKRSATEQQRQRSRRRGSVAVLGDSYDKPTQLRNTKGGEGDAGDDDDVEELQGTTSRRGSTSNGKQTTQLTAEYVGALLSQLTPEALGFASTNESKKQKRRKSSVAMTETLGGGGDDNDSEDKKSRRASAHPRRASITSKSGGGSSATGLRRKSSVAGKGSSRRASVASKKS
jgi:parallel beta-helix repeat protein